MQTRTRLFSYSQIVGISIFLSVIILFSFTGFQLPIINFPEFIIINPFENQLETYCKTLEPHKQIYCDLAHEFKNTNEYPELQNHILVIKTTNCSDLESLLRTNTAWDIELRAYIAYRIINECA